MCGLKMAVVVQETEKGNGDSRGSDTCVSRDRDQNSPALKRIWTQLPYLQL